MKKILLLMMAAICGFAGVEKMSAATELYAVLTNSSTVTFYYDDQRSSRGGSVKEKQCKPELPAAEDKLSISYSGHLRFNHHGCSEDHPCTDQQPEFIQGY